MGNEFLSLTGLRSSELQAHVVGHDLSPLHVVDGVLGILHFAISEGVHRDQASVRQLLPSNRNSWCGDSIGILGSQETRITAIETSSRRVSTNMDVINYQLRHLRGSGDSCAWVGQVVASASQCTVRRLFAMRRWNSARLLLDSTELDSPELVTVTSAVSLQIAKGE